MSAELSPREEHTRAVTETRAAIAAMSPSLPEPVAEFLSKFPPILLITQGQRQERFNTSSQAWSHPVDGRRYAVMTRRSVGEDGLMRKVIDLCVSNEQGHYMLISTAVGLADMLVMGATGALPHIVCRELERQVTRARTR